MGSAASWSLIVTVTFAILLCLSAGLVSSLQCYNCGRYTDEGAGSVSPCYSYEDMRLELCAPTERFCMKYVNKGIIVRQCAAECEPGYRGQTEMYCCTRDGCNVAETSRTPLTMALLSISLLTSFINQSIH